MLRWSIFNVWPHRRRWHFFLLLLFFVSFSPRDSTYSWYSVRTIGMETFLFSQHSNTQKTMKRGSTLCVCESLFVSFSFVLLLLRFSRLYIGKGETHALSLLNRRRRVSERSIKTKEKKSKSNHIFCFSNEYELYDYVFLSSSDLKNGKSR